MGCCISKRNNDELYNKKPTLYKKYQTLSNKNIILKKEKLHGYNFSCKKTIFVYSIIMVFAIISTIVTKGCAAPGTVPTTAAASFYVSEESIKLHQNNLKIEIMDAILQERKEKGEIFIDNLSATLLVKDIKVS